MIKKYQKAGIINKPPIVLKNDNTKVAQIQYVPNKSVASKEELLLLIIKNHIPQNAVVSQGKTSITPYDEQKQKESEKKLELLIEDNKKIKNTEKTMKDLNGLFTFMSPTFWYNQATGSDIDLNSAKALGLDIALDPTTYASLGFAPLLKTTSKKVPAKLFSKGNRHKYHYTTSADLPEFNRQLKQIKNPIEKLDFKFNIDRNLIFLEGKDRMLNFINSPEYKLRLSNLNISPEIIDVMTNRINNLNLNKYADLEDRVIGDYWPAYHKVEFSNQYLPKDKLESNVNHEIGHGSSYNEGMYPHPLLKDLETKNSELFFKDAKLLPKPEDMSLHFYDYITDEQEIRSRLIEILFDMKKENLSFEDYYNKYSSVVRDWNKHLKLMNEGANKSLMSFNDYISKYNEFKNAIEDLSKIYSYEDLKKILYKFGATLPAAAILKNNKTEKKKNGGRLIKKYLPGGSFYTDDTGRIFTIPKEKIHVVSDLEDSFDMDDYVNPKNLTTTAAKTILQVLDPTGVSSYPDVAEAYKNLKSDFSVANAGNLGLEVLGALPVVGKIPKGLKIIRTVTKSPKLRKAVKNATSKYVIQPIANQLIPKALDEFKLIDDINKGVDTVNSGSFVINIGLGANEFLRINKQTKK